VNLEQAQIAALLSNFRGRHAADDQDVGILVKYIGAQASGTVTVTVTTGDITFKHGALASEVVDPTIDSANPSDPGVIDVSETNSDKMGEVVDMINASANWEAKLVDCLRADASTAGMLLTMAETQAKVTGGLKLYKDTSNCLNISLAIDRSIFKGIEFDNALWINTILSIISKITNASADTLIQIYSINRANKTEVKVYSRAGGATATEQVLPTSGVQMQLDSFRDDILLVRAIGTACAGYLTIVGKQTNFNNPDY